MLFRSSVREEAGLTETGSLDLAIFMPGPDADTEEIESISLSKILEADRRNYERHQVEDKQTQEDAQNVQKDTLHIQEDEISDIEQTLGSIFREPVRPARSEDETRKHRSQSSTSTDEKDDTQTSQSDQSETTESDTSKSRGQKTHPLIRESDDFPEAILIGKTRRREDVKVIDDFLMATRNTELRKAIVATRDAMDFSRNNIERPDYRRAWMTLTHEADRRGLDVDTGQIDPDSALDPERSRLHDDQLIRRTDLIRSDIRQSRRTGDLEL